MEGSKLHINFPQNLVYKSISKTNTILAIQRKEVKNQGFLTAGATRWRAHRRAANGQTTGEQQSAGATHWTEHRRAANGQTTGGQQSAAFLSALNANAKCFKLQVIIYRN